MTDLFFCIIFAALLVRLINCHKSSFLTPIAEMLGLRPKAGSAADNVPNDGLDPTQAGL